MESRQRDIRRRSTENLRQALPRCWTARPGSLPLTESHGLTSIVPGQLLRSASHLRLKRQITRALNGSHEFRQILLLRFYERDTLLLQTQCVVEKSADVLLVCLISSGHFRAELPPGLALLHHELILLRREPRIRLRELGELGIGETEPLLRHLGGLFAEALLERGAIRVGRCGNRLGSGRGCRKKQRHRAKEEGSSPHLDPWSSPSPLSTEIAGPGSVAGSASKLFMSFMSWRRLLSLSASTLVARARACACGGSMLTRG